MTRTCGSKFGQYLGDEGLVSNALANGYDRVVRCRTGMGWPDGAARDIGPRAADSTVAPSAAAREPGNRSNPTPLRNVSALFGRLSEEQAGPVGGGHGRPMTQP